MQAELYPNFPDHILRGDADSDVPLNPSPKQLKDHGLRSTTPSNIRSA